MTGDEINNARARVNERIAARAEAKLPPLDYDQTVADALNVLAKEKRWVATEHWIGRLRDRWHRRVERRIERRLNWPFRFTYMSAIAVQQRWPAVLGRFVRRNVERRFGLDQPVSLADVQRAYRGEHPT